MYKRLIAVVFPCAAVVVFVATISLISAGHDGRREESSAMSANRAHDHFCDSVSLSTGAVWMPIICFLGICLLVAMMVVGNLAVYKPRPSKRQDGQSAEEGQAGQSSQKGKAGQSAEKGQDGQSAEEVAMKPSDFRSPCWLFVVTMGLVGWGLSAWVMVQLGDGGYEIRSIFLGSVVVLVPLFLIARFFLCGSCFNVEKSPGLHMYSFFPFSDRPFKFLPAEADLVQIQRLAVLICFDIPIFSIEISIAPEIFSGCSASSTALWLASILVSGLGVVLTLCTSPTFIDEDEKPSVIGKLDDAQFVADVGTAVAGVAAL